MPIDAAVAAHDLEVAIGRVGTPERAVSEKRYLKSDLAFLGTTVGETRAAVKVFANVNRLNHEDLVSVAIALWDVPIFERRCAPHVWSMLGNTLGRPVPSVHWTL